MDREKFAELKLVADEVIDNVLGWPNGPQADAQTVNETIERLAAISTTAVFKAFHLGLATGRAEAGSADVDPIGTIS